jgi:ryanodine receptor 2
MTRRSKILSSNIMSSRVEVYVPDPTPTHGIEIPESLLKLIELLAEHNHEVWAEQRIKDGWTYGVQRDDRRKTHPCLVPYGALPEKEKAYDRNTAIALVKLIIKLGYHIEER